MRRTPAPGVLIGDELEAVAAGTVDHGLERGHLVGIVGEVLIAVGDRGEVPGPDPDVVGIAQVERAVRGDGYQWMGIVHDGGAFNGRGQEIVGQAKRVPHLVSGELTQSSERQLGQFGCRFVAGDERRQQPRRQEVILAHAERPERDVPLDDLPGTGIPHGGPVAPTAR